VTRVRVLAPSHLAGNLGTVMPTPVAWPDQSLILVQLDTYPTPLPFSPHELEEVTP
jgi:hypothetical protein